MVITEDPRLDVVRPLPCAGSGPCACRRRVPVTAAAQLLDRIVPIVRTRLPRGVDVDYLDDFLGRNRPVLEAVIEQNLGPLLRRMEAANDTAFAVEDIPEFWTAAKASTFTCRAGVSLAALNPAGRDTDGEGH